MPLLCRPVTQVLSYVSESLPAGKLLRHDAVCLQGFIQYVNTSSGLDVVLEKVVDWQIGQPGPFSLIQLAGAACAQYTITESGECNSTSAFLVDNTAAQQASDLIVPLSQLDSALSVDQPEGIVTSSICDVDCEDHMVGLNALSAYDFVLNNDADEVCDVTTTFTAYDSTSPGMRLMVIIG